MSTTIVLKKGLDIPISGESELRVSKTIAPGIVAVCPTDFKGLLPRMEGKRRKRRGKQKDRQAAQARHRNSPNTLAKSGPRRTTMVAGKMKRSRGKSILVGASWASFSARSKRS